MFIIPWSFFDLTRLVAEDGTKRESENVLISEEVSRYQHRKFLKSSDREIEMTYRGRRLNYQ